MQNQLQSVGDPDLKINRPTASRNFFEHPFNTQGRRRYYFSPSTSKMNAAELQPSTVCRNGMRGSRGRYQLPAARREVCAENLSVNKRQKNTSK